ncbi:MAG: DUF4198 domain-containing protein [Chromatiales bacterium]|nr:DUF4198 domain-containing protein [Chromatiales bacterium]
MHSRLTTRSLPAIALAGAALCHAVPALAHDFWIEPAVFTPAAGASLPVTLRVGEDFNGTSQPFVPDWFVDFSVTSAAGRERVRGFVGDDPATTLALQAPGLRLIGYHSTRSFVDLDAERFDKYLQAEGLESVRELRRQRGQDKASGREYYSRCAKSLVSAGDGPAAGFDRVLGYPLELIPQANPYALAPGKALPLVLHYRGKPIPDVLVIAFTADQPARRFQARTGADGRVTLPLDRAGRWLVKAVHMIEVPDTDPAADWESFWASLTFEVRGRA